MCGEKKIHVTRRHGAGGGGSARVRVVVAGSRARAYRPGRSISPLRTLTNRAARGFILIKFRYLFVRVCSFPSPPPTTRFPAVTDAFHAIFAFCRTSSSTVVYIHYSQSSREREPDTIFLSLQLFRLPIIGNTRFCPRPPAHVSSSCTRTHIIV